MEGGGRCERRGGWCRQAGVGEGGVEVVCWEGKVEVGRWEREGAAGGGGVYVGRREWRWRVGEGKGEGGEVGVWEGQGGGV